MHATPYSRRGIFFSNLLHNKVTALINESGENAVFGSHCGNDNSSLAEDLDVIADGADQIADNLDGDSPSCSQSLQKWPKDKLIEQFLISQRKLEQKNHEIRTLSEALNKLRTELNDFFYDSFEDTEEIEEESSIGSFESVNCDDEQVELFVRAQKLNSRSEMKLHELGDLLSQHYELSDALRTISSLQEENKSLIIKANTADHMSDETAFLRQRLEDLTRSEDDTNRKYQRLLEQSQGQFRNEKQLEAAENTIKFYEADIEHYSEQVISLQVEIQRKNELLLAAEGHINIMESLDKKMVMLEEKYCEQTTVDNMFYEKYSFYEDMIKKIRQAVQFTMILLQENVCVSEDLSKDIGDLRHEINFKGLYNPSSPSLNMILSHGSSDSSTQTSDEYAIKVYSDATVNTVNQRMNDFEDAEILSLFETIENADKKIHQLMSEKEDIERELSVAQRESCEKNCACVKTNLTMDENSLESEVGNTSSDNDLLAYSKVEFKEDTKQAERLEAKLKESTKFINQLQTDIDSLYNENTALEIRNMDLFEKLQDREVQQAGRSLEVGLPNKFLDELKSMLKAEIIKKNERAEILGQLNNAWSNYDNVFKQNKEFEMTKNKLLLEIKFLQKINQLSKKDANKIAVEQSLSTNKSTDVSMHIDTQKNRENVCVLQKENADLKRKLFSLGKRDLSFDTLHYMSIGRFGHDQLDAYNIPELIRICRVIIARRGMFTLNMMELATIAKAIAIAAEEKDPNRKIAGTISFDLCNQKERIQHLENELFESKKMLKLLSKQRGEFKIFIDAKPQCSQLAKDRISKRKP